MSDDDQDDHKSKSTTESINVDAATDEVRLDDTRTAKQQRKADRNAKRKLNQAKKERKAERAMAKQRKASKRKRQGKAR